MNGAVTVEAFLRQARVLVVGCGSIGRRHARLLRELGVIHLEVCDSSAPNRAYVQAELSIAKGYDQLDDALQEPLDAAFICTPPALHIPQALRVIEAGADVFIEKPLSDRLDQVAGLERCAAERNKRVMVGLCMRYHPGLLRVKQLVAEGAIGRVISARALVGVYLPELRPGLDYRQLYISQPGGGVTLDYLHEIDFVQWIIGARVRQVFALTGKLSDLEMQADDTAALTLEFENRAIAEIHLDVFERAKRRLCEFMGTAGTILLDLANWKACILQIYRSACGAWETETLAMGRDDIYLAEDRAFLQACASQTAPELDARVGAVSLEIALAAIQSSRERRLVQLLPG